VLPTTPAAAPSSATGTNAAPASSSSGSFANRGSLASSSGRSGATTPSGLYEHPELQQALRSVSYPNTKLGRRLKEIWLKSHSGVDLLAHRQSLKHLKEVGGRTLAACCLVAYTPALLYVPVQPAL
jgi:hypothetical protein